LFRVRFPNDDAGSGEAYTLYVLEANMISPEGISKSLERPSATTSDTGFLRYIKLPRRENPVGGRMEPMPPGLRTVSANCDDRNKDLFESS
jgi:hypothetical protein